MQPFSHYLNRTGFRVAFYALLAMLLVFVGAYAAFYRVSDASKIEQIANRALSETQRKIKFQPDVGRRLFPRPTIILRDVTLTEADGKTPAASVGEVRIGIAWSSLIGSTEIEKLVLNQVAAVVSRNERGEWDFGDLLSQQQGKSLPINRIQINNGSILFHINQQQIQFSKIYYSHERVDNQFPYTLSASGAHQSWNQLNLNATGYAGYDESGNIVLPNFQMKFNGQENNQDFSGSLATKIIANPKQVVAEDSKLIVRSNRFNSHSDINIKKIAQMGNDWHIQDVNSVFTGSQGNNQYNGSVAVGESRWQNQQWQSQEMHVHLNTQNPQYGTSVLNLDGSANWQANQGFTMPDVKMTTRLEQLNKLPSLISEFSGSLNVKDSQHWQVLAQGILDRQPAAMSFVRENNNVAGVIQLAKFNLTNYMDFVQQGADSAYPDWLRDVNLRVDWAISTLNLPNLEINNIRSTLLANNKQMLFEPLIADLYSGHTEGSLKIDNAQPLQYSLTQKAHDVQILPLMQDLFRNGSLSGKGNAELSFKTTGSTRQQLTENLSGSLNVDLKEGSWHGLNITELMNNADKGESKLQSGNSAATPFSSFVLKSRIEKGVSQHSIVSEFSQLAAQMVSKGQTNLFNGQISDDVILYSNNKQNVLPIRLSGTLDNPTISLNYDKLTRGLKTPEQKKAAVENALKKQWDWLKESAAASQPEKPSGNSEAATLATVAPLIAPLVAAKVEPKAEPKVEPKTEPKVETKVEPKAEPKVETKVAPKVEAKTQPKAEPKVEPKKSSDKKSDDKKPEPKKPEPKKSTEKKPVEKKAVEKKPEPKKSVEKKAEPKKSVEKKPVEKKAVAKKATDKKPEPKKATDKKSDDKKPAAKKSTQPTNKKEKK